MAERRTGSGHRQSRPGPEYSSSPEVNPKRHRPRRCTQHRMAPLPAWLSLFPPAQPALNTFVAGMGLVARLTDSSLQLCPWSLCRVVRSSKWTAAATDRKRNPAYGLVPRLPPDGPANDLNVDTPHTYQGKVVVRRVERDFDSDIANGELVLRNRPGAAGIRQVHRIIRGVRIRID